MLDEAVMLKRCGERLTKDDVALLRKTSRDIQARVLLEIGSAGGCSTLVLGETAREFGGRLYCIDPAPEGRWFGNIEWRDLKDYVFLVEEYSPWISPSRVMTPIDYLFIDGDHRTRWVLMDYHYWFRYVRVGGRIAFHDWNDGPDGAQVREAIDMILETDSDALKLVGEAKAARTRGSIVFEKQIEEVLNPRGL